MLQVFDFAVYVFTDVEEKVYFVSSNVSMNLYVISEQNSYSLSVTTLASKCILAERFYRDCPISINHNNTIFLDYDVFLWID